MEEERVELPPEDAGLIPYLARLLERHDALPRLREEEEE